VDFGVKFIPQTGRFLPYALLGVGFSWRQLTFENENLGFAYTATYGKDSWTPPNPKCSAPYSQLSESSGKTENYTCGYNVSLKPDQQTINLFGFDLVAGVGAEYLITQNIGIKFEVRYIMTYLFSGDLTAKFWSDKQEYNPAGEKKPVQYGDAFPIWQLQHAISASAGVIAYW
jgi:opacity protein-like surface antigen